MLRRFKASDLEGKTIKKVDDRNVNVLKFTFDDGTVLELWAEDSVYTEYGNIPGFFVEEHSTPENT